MQLGRFDIDPDKRRLQLEGQTVHLGSRAFDILATIVAAQVRLVTRQQLMDAVWPGLIVEDGNIDVHISTIPKALGPDRDFIVTVSGRGSRRPNISRSRPFHSTRKRHVL